MDNIASGACGGPPKTRHVLPALGRRSALSVSLAALLRRPAMAAAPQEVKVALLAPLTGPWARQGQMMQAGAAMAVYDINAAGGIKALGGAPMRLLVFDAGTSAETARNAAQRMVAQEPDLVGGSGAWLSSFTLAVTEVTERAGLPWLTESYSDAITSRGFRFVFQTAMTAGRQSLVALEKVLDVAKAAGANVKRLGIVADDSAGEQSFLRPIRTADPAERPLQLVMDQTYTPPLTDATTLVQRVRSSRPELLFLGASNASDSKLLLDKLHEYGLDRGRIAIYGNGEAMATSEMRDIVGVDELDGLFVVVVNWGGKGQEGLAAQYMARTGEPWLGQDTLQTYFDMLLFKEAVERAGAADRGKVADVLRAIDITDGPATLLPGRRVKFDGAGRIVDGNLVIVQWQGGRPVPVYPESLATAKPIWPQRGTP